MLIQIDHTTRFHYTDRVFIEPMTVRLRPRTDCFQKLIDFKLDVDPLPKGISESVDMEGNITTCIWSAGLVNTLTISASSVVETHNLNPFNFILTDENMLSLPGEYSSYYLKALGPYMERSYSGEEVEDFAEKILKNEGSNPLTFINGLNQHIHHKFQRIERKAGEPLHPSQLLKMQEGSCRDFAVLFIDACRCVGLAARFTSGYYFSDQEQFEHELHAWPEVYLPGGGWRGFDPTLGIAVADQHVAVASGVEPALAAPTYGSFRGTGVDSTLEYTVSISARNSSRDHPQELAS